MRLAALATGRPAPTGRPRGAVFSENFPTFGANFLYGVIPDLSNGYRCRASARRKNQRRICDLTHGPVVREIVGFGLFWLGITHPTDHPGAPRRGSFPAYRCPSALSST